MGEPSFPSPTGAYRVRVHPWEARMSLWVEYPVVEDTASGTPLFAFKDRNWSLNNATWLDQHTVRLGLRKYPGTHEPPELWVQIDCASRRASVADREVALKDLSALADAALWWPAQPKATAESILAEPGQAAGRGNLLQKLGAWFRGEG